MKRHLPRRLLHQYMDTGQLLDCPPCILVYNRSHSPPIRNLSTMPQKFNRSTPEQLETHSLEPPKLARFRLQQTLNPSLQMWKYTILQVPSFPSEIVQYPSLKMILHTMTTTSNIYESGHLPILQIPKSYNLSSYFLLSFLDVLSRDFLCLILLLTWTLKRERMVVLKEDISNLGQDPCVSVQNSARTLGKVVVVHDLSFGGSEFFVE